MWSSSSRCWRVRCPIKPSRACTTVLARRRRTATAGPLECVFLRNHRKIPPYREGARAERGGITLAQAAAQLKVSEAKVRRLISEHILPPIDSVKGLPG